MSAIGFGGRGGFFRFDPSQFGGRAPEVQKQAESLARSLASPVRAAGHTGSATQYVPAMDGANAFSVEADRRGAFRVTGIESLRGDLVVYYTDPDGERRQAPLPAELLEQLEEQSKALELLEETFKRFAEQGRFDEKVDAELQQLVRRVRALQADVMGRIDLELGFSSRLMERPEG